MSDAIIASIVGISGTLLGVAMGWLLNRWTVNHAVNQQEFYKAAAAFRAAFTDEYRALKTIVRPEDVENTFVQSTLANAAAKHENACILFRPYLSDKKKQEFDRAWKNYLIPEGGDLAELPSPFIDYYSESRDDAHIRLALDRLDKLMEFAKPM
jgi:hypothetical protein